MHPRWVKDGSVYSLTQRTIDRVFLFIPCTFIRNLVGACAARALAKFPVKLFWLDVNINHEHMGVGPLDGTAKSFTHMVRFKQLYHRLLAEEINHYLGREGGIFSTPSRDTECLDNESTMQQMGYAMTNPVKDGLVERAVHWKGFSSFGALATGENPAYTYIDWTAWHKAGGVRSGKAPEAFTKSIHLAFRPLPGTEHLSAGERQSRIRRYCGALEQSFREERERTGQRVMGKARLEKLDHRDRPKSKPVRSRKPLCHAASKETALAYIDSFREFLKAYRAASCSYRLGCEDVEFPAGSFKPPLIEAAA
jgi:hypothetical protein